MAGTKESPRQKMVGMMYLVLTALLALQVSKDVVSAFITLENKIGRVNQTIDHKNTSIIGQLQNAAIDPKFKEEATKWLKVAKNVRNLTDRSYQYLDEIKLELIQLSEGKDWKDEKKEWLDEKRKIVHFKPFSEIETKADYDAVNTYMIGSDPENPSGEAIKLKDKIHLYRDSLLLIMSSVEKGKKVYSYNPFKDQLDFSNTHSGDTSIIRFLGEYLSVPNMMYDDYLEKNVLWETGSFYYSPLAASLALLTSIQGDLRNAEGEVLRHLFANIGQSNFMFNKIEAIALSGKSYLNIGDSLSIDVMLAAIDTLNQPQVFLKKGEENIALHVKGGRGKLNLIGDTPGNYQLTGRIGIETKTGIEYKPWYYNYQVGKPDAAIENKDMKMLYYGYTNKVSISATGYTEEQVKLVGSNCNVINKGQGEYHILVNKGARNVELNVVASNEKGERKSLKRQSYRVMLPPKPTIFFGSMNYNDNGKKIRKNDITSLQTLTAKLDGNSPLSIRYKVSRFDMVIDIPDKAINIKLSSPSFKLTNKMKNEIRRLPRGATLTFKNIYFEGSKVKGLSKESLEFVIR